jgi:hypothetical protein
MADMQTLAALVQRLESQGVDVMALLQGAAMGGAGAMGSGAITAGEEFMGRMGPRTDEEFMGRRMPPMKPFEGPGPGAVMDMEQTQRMMENRNRMPDFMKPAFNQLMQNGAMTGPRPVRPVAPGILKLLGGM